MVFLVYVVGGIDPRNLGLILRFQYFSASLFDTRYQLSAFLQHLNCMRNDLKHKLAAEIPEDVARGIAVAVLPEKLLLRQQQ